KAEPIGGWSRLDGRLEEYVSKDRYSVVRIDGRRCENVIQRKNIHNGLITYEGLRALEEKGGADLSTFGWGVYPTETMSFGIISPATLDACRGRFIWGRIPVDLGALDMAEE